MKYRVCVRKIVEDAEVNNNEWTDEYYSEPFIKADCVDEALFIAMDFIRDCGYNPEDYDFMVIKYK